MSFYCHFRRDASSPSVCICAVAKLGLKTNCQDGYLWFRQCWDEPGSISCSPPRGINLTCRAAKGAAPAHDGAGWCVLLIKVLSVCVSGVLSPHLIAHCYSHTFCEVTAVTPLSQLSMRSCYHTRHRTTGAASMWRRTGHVGL